MPRFPIDAIGQMTREEKFTMVAIYLAKTIEHLQGEPHEPIYPVRRPNTYGPTSSQVSPVVQIKDVLPNLTEAISSLSDQQECEDTGVPIETVDQSAD